MNPRSRRHDRRREPEPGARLAAVRILERRFAPGVPLDQQYSGRPFLDLAPADRALCRQLVDGVLRNLSLIDSGLQEVAARPLERIDDPIRWLLRVTVCQIRFLRVPDYAAVNEAVGLCRSLGRSYSRSFVNGVLRAYLAAMPEPPAGDTAEDLSVRFSHPRWLVARLLDRHGTTTTRELLQANNSFPPSVVWVNPLKTSVEEFCRNLAEDGIPAEALASPPNSVRIEARGFVRHPLYRAGHCFFMDASSQRVAGLADLAGRKSVADFCAAPGGKSFLVAARLGTQARVLCCDVSLRRLREMEKRSRLLGISNLHLVQSDCAAAVPLHSNWDLILADVPCSGLGTLRSNPDLRWFVCEADLPGWRQRQGEILRQAYSHLKAGGEVVYSTCSTEPEENDEVVQGLLRSEPAAVLVGEFFRTLPGQGLGDGFFAARIRRG